jgi:hypothetical protein
VVVGALKVLLCVLALQVALNGAAVLAAGVDPAHQRAIVAAVDLFLVAVAAVVGEVFLRLLEEALVVALQLT